MNPVVSHLANRRALRGVVQNARSLQRRWGKKAPNKRKGFSQARPLSLRGQGKRSAQRDDFISLWGMERAHAADLLAVIKKFLTD